MDSSEVKIDLDGASPEIRKVFCQSNAFLAPAPKVGDKCPHCGEKLPFEAVKDWVFGELVYYHCPCGYKFAKPKSADSGFFSCAD